MRGGVAFSKLSKSVQPCFCKRKNACLNHQNSPLSVCPSVHPSVRHIFCQSVRPSVNTSVSPCICFCLSLTVSVRLYVSASLSVSLSVVCWYSDGSLHAAHAIIWVSTVIWILNWSKNPNLYNAECLFSGDTSLCLSKVGRAFLYVNALNYRRTCSILSVEIVTIKKNQHDDISIVSRFSFEPDSGQVFIDWELCKSWVLG